MGNQARRRGHAASLCAPSRCRDSATPLGARGARIVALAAALSVLAWLHPAGARAWQVARVEPRIDNLGELLCGCEERRAAALERNRQIDTWVAFNASQGEDVRKQVQRTPVPDCSAAPLQAAVAGKQPGVWAIATAPDGDLFATVDLPVPALLVSGDGGHTWHYRHLFLPGYNVPRATLLRGLDVGDGLLAIASENGVLLSHDDGYTFDTALEGKPFSAVAIAGEPSPVPVAVATAASARPAGAPRALRIAAGGNGTSFLSDDGGRTWSDLAFSRFTATLRSHNPYRIDQITSLRFDPRSADVVYVGTGSHLYRAVLASGRGRWQAMEGLAGGHVLDDSTVYNIEFGSRMMISTCNGVYYLESPGSDSLAPQADVRWGKFRDATFTHRGVGGPSLNLRAYFVTEDPDERGRVLIADFAGMYEGKSDGVRMRWRRIPDLPYYSPVSGYPEYTSIAWTDRGDVVVGSRYRGIFVEEREAPAPVVNAATTTPTSAARAGCVLK